MIPSCEIIPTGTQWNRKWFLARWQGQEHGPGEATTVMRRHHHCYDLNNSDFIVVIVTVSSASGSLKAEPKECLTSKGQVLSKGL